MTRTKTHARGSSRAPGRSGNRAASYLGTGVGPVPPLHDSQTARSPSVGNVSPGAKYEDLAAGHVLSAQINLEIAKRARDRGDTHEQIEVLGLVITHCLRAAAYMGYAEEKRRG